jgi:crossover junction endodeoxyribonuclease RuvC
MIVLGIDPGLSMAGWGVVSKGQKDRISLLEYGCIKTYPSTCLAERLKFLYTEIQSVIIKYKPEVVAVEEIFFLKGSKVIATVGQARGALISAVAINKIPVFEYNPIIVKIALTGYGSADKHQMQHMVKSILGLKEIPKPDDSADALAMAICHLNTNRY